MTKRQRAASQAIKQSSVIRIRGTRMIRGSTRLLLFVRAGGRCQFDGCNKFPLRHPLTLARGNFGQMAHVVAFSKAGPRGRGVRPKDINDVVNLMLLCTDCHKLIDTDPEKYSVAVLEKYKAKHEERIHHVTGLGPDLKTTVVQLKSRIAGQTVAIPAADITSAVAPAIPSRSFDSSTTARCSRCTTST